MKKLIYEDIKEYIDATGETLLSETYKNSVAKLKIKCSNGHIYYKSWNKFQKGQRCPIESGKMKYEYKQVKDYIESFGFKLISTEYKNNHSKLYIQCPVGHDIRMSFHSFKIDNMRCAKCYGNKKKTHEEVKNYMASFGYKLLSTEYVNSTEELDVQCPKDHKVEMSWASFQQGQRCPECFGTKKYEYEYIRNYFKKFDYILISKEYKNNHTKITTICPKCHFYSVKFNDFQQGIRCPKCQQKSLQELKEFKDYDSCVRYQTNQNYGKYYYQINPKDLKRSYNGYHLDHIYSVSDGFKNNVSIDIVSNPNNLRLIKSIDNMHKSSKSEITKQLLYHIAI